MAAAGLTSGAFYAHFRSKSELLEAIVENELNRSIALFSNKSIEGLLVAIEGYLSREHVEHPESGCMVPSLAPEVSRSNASTKRVFEAGIVGLKVQIESLGVGEANAWSIIAQLTGAVMVARGLHSETARTALLEGVTQQVKQILENTSRAPAKRRGSEA